MASKKEREYFNALFALCVIILLFVVVSYFVQENSAFLEENIGNSIEGMIIYIFFVILAVVIAPINTAPVVPISIALWGFWGAVVLNIIGWMLGSIFAFLLARRFGVGIVKRFVSLEKLYAFEKKIPQENMFWSVVGLRIIMPVDLLSYALGLFTKMRLGRFIAATFIGILPAVVWFIYFLSYVGQVPVLYQFIVAGVLVVVLAVWFLVSKIVERKK